MKEKERRRREEETERRKSEREERARERQKVCVPKVIYWIGNPAPTTSFAKFMKSNTNNNTHCMCT